MMCTNDLIDGLDVQHCSNLRLVDGTEQLVLMMVYSMG